MSPTDRESRSLILHFPEESGIAIFTFEIINGEWGRKNALPVSDGRIFGAAELL